MTHKEAMQLIRENLEQGLYTYDHLIEQYAQFAQNEPNLDLSDEVKDEIYKLAQEFPSLIGRDGQEWFGNEPDEA